MRLPTNVKYFGGKFFWRLKYFTEKGYTNSEEYSEIRKEIQKACHNPEADEGLIDDCIEFRRDECKKQAGKNVDGSELDQQLHDPFFSYWSMLYD